MWNPYKWFWKADDGRVYSSELQAQVPESNALYVTFLEQGSQPTPWPRDLAGNQTDAELQSVLQVHNLFANLAYYAADARWRKEQAGMTVTVTTGTFPIKTDDRSQAKINGVRLIADIKGALPAGTTTPWAAADGNIYTLGIDDVLSMSDQLQQYVNACFATYASVVSDIDAGTITTRQQVDEAFATMVTTFGPLTRE